MPSSAIYCPGCGAQTRTDQGHAPVVSSTEFDRLTQDRGVQEHWFSRVIAFIIDFFIFWIVFGIISVVYWLAIGLPAIVLGSATLGLFQFNPFGIASIGWLGNILFVLYFAIAEAWYGRTIGKGIMRLHVVTTGGTSPDFGNAFLRNLSKIFLPLLLLDIILGLFTRTRPGQKFTDHYAHTIVAKY
jgi:uncharacterized RDD family membrane protein YckC